MSRIVRLTSVKTLLLRLFCALIVKLNHAENRAGRIGSWKGFTKCRCYETYSPLDCITKHTTPVDVLGIMRSLLALYVYLFLIDSSANIDVTGIATPSCYSISPAPVTPVISTPCHVVLKL